MIVNCDHKTFIVKATAFEESVVAFTINFVTIVNLMTLEIINGAACTISMITIIIDSSISLLK
jgi:hypothetical protein